MGLGVAKQEQDARTVAGLRGWTVAQIDADNDVRACSTQRSSRHEFERLLDDLAAGVIDGCVVYDLVIASLESLPTLSVPSRFFHDRPGMAFATVQGDIDLSSPDGRTMARVMVAFARNIFDGHLDACEAKAP